MPHRNPRRPRSRTDDDDEDAPRKRPTRRALREYRVSLVTGSVDSLLATGHTPGFHALILWAPHVKGESRQQRVYNNDMWISIDTGDPIPGTEKLDDIVKPKKRRDDDNGDNGDNGDDG